VLVKKTLVLVLALVIVVGAAVWRFPEAADAAAVDGSTISTSSFYGDLAAISAHPDFVCYLKVAAKAQGQGFTSTQGATPGTYSTDFAAYWLTRRINAEAAKVFDAQHHLKVTSADLATAQERYIASIDAVGSLQGSTCTAKGAAVLAELPAGFRAAEIARQADYDAMLAATNAALADPSKLQAFYAAHLHDFDTYCLSGIVGTQAQVAQAQAEIAAGMSFAEAAAKFSQDPSSAAKGGQLGCWGPTSAAYANVVAIAGKVPAGQLAPPYVNQYGNYILVKVDTRTPTPYAEAAAAVRTAFEAAGQQASAAVLGGLLYRAEVAVNPAIGFWNHVRGDLKVLPPAKPAR